MLGLGEQVRPRVLWGPGNSTGSEVGSPSSLTTQLMMVMEALRLSLFGGQEGLEANECRRRVEPRQHCVQVEPTGRCGTLVGQLPAVPRLKIGLPAGPAPAHGPWVLAWAGAHAEPRGQLLLLHPPGLSPRSPAPGPRPQVSGRNPHRCAQLP